jgi:4-hydroxythreonine-4-phosphate dehydrogenase
MPPTAPLAITMGDPAGIGPEIVMKAWAAMRGSGPAFLVVGDHQSLTSAGGSGSAAVRRISAPFEAAEVFPHAVPVLDLPLNKPVVAGQPSPTYASAVIRWIETAVGLALSGAVRGIVTAPIAKKPLYDAGFPFPGHTEFLADLVAGEAFAGPRGPVMMLAALSPAVPLYTALVTSHCALRDVPRGMSIDRIVRTGRVLHDALRRDFGVADPRIALAGLNPHAGEGGALGEEEIETVNPAAAALRSLGVNCSDARSADTLFHEDARRGYDAVICLYHDQALIPVKTLDFWGGINVTLGLPIVRTSPDHGTSFEIAGRGVARADSLIAAIRAADAIADRRTERPAAALSVVAA